MTPRIPFSTASIAAIALAAIVAAEMLWLILVPQPLFPQGHTALSQKSHQENVR